jgi:hypothetical protein
MISPLDMTPAIDDEGLLATFQAQKSRGAHIS